MGWHKSDAIHFDFVLLLIHFDFVIFTSFYYLSIDLLMCLCYGDFPNIERSLRNFIVVTVEKRESVICKHILKSLKLFFIHCECKLYRVKFKYQVSIHHNLSAMVDFR